jgi:hypothetical protein
VRKYYRFQLVKSAYIAFLLLITSILGSGFIMPTIVSIAEFWGMLWRSSLFVYVAALCRWCFEESYANCHRAPYWGALWYGFVMKRESSDLFEDGGGRFW